MKGVLLVCLRVGLLLVFGGLGFIEIIFIDF